MAMIYDIEVKGGLVAQVSTRADYDLVRGYSWCLSNGYATTSINKKTIRMHRLIMQNELADGLVVDHINGDKLDNRRENLRVCTHAENMRNRKPHGGSSVYKGVSWYKRDNKWLASIAFDGRAITIGRYENEIEAARAYDQKARELHAEFARLNFPDN